MKLGQTKEHPEWRQPPPGTVIVPEGEVLEGDWFYVVELGAWAPVPKIGWGQPVGPSLIARGVVDLTRVKRL